MVKMTKPDYMSQDEYEDLEKMKEAVIYEKLKIVDYMLSMLRYNETDFKHSGYKGLEDALVKVLKSLNKTVDKLNESYIKKYPD